MEGNSVPDSSFWNSVRCIPLVVAAAMPGLSGCATLAHKTDASGLHARRTEKCDGANGVCPWVAADCAWLLAGVVPGVVALVVDWGTGCWNHDNLGR
ncbi:MAG: hypothetical protein AABZ12_02560 [Planctomycetota bacterium]